MDCEPDTVYRSPFFQAAQTNSRFLELALRTVAGQKKLVPGCTGAVSQCRAHLEMLEKKVAKL
jgi:hypothetical protein